MPRHTEELGPGEWAVLALLCQRPSHGWAVASRLGRSGDIGAIWSLGQPLVYHGLSRLEERRFIVATGIERGARGPHRVIYAPTEEGRQQVATWLAEPVDRVRDVRSLFLLKVVLAQNLDLDVEPLLRAERRVIEPLALVLEVQLDDARAEGVPKGDLTALRFRLETTRSVVRFIDDLLDNPS